MQATLAIYRYHARRAERAADQAITGRVLLARDLREPRLTVEHRRCLLENIFQCAQTSAIHSRIAMTVRDGFEPITHRGSLRA